MSSLIQIELTDSSSGQSDNSITIRKRKRFILTPTPTTETITILDQPLSQLSISQSHLKRTKMKTATINTQLNKENIDSSIGLNGKLKPRYLKVSDQVFKQMLSKCH